jgi:voltage-gated potassium channel
MPPPSAERPPLWLPAVDDLAIASPPDPHDNVTLRHRVYEILEGTRDNDRLADCFERFLVVLILLNIAAFAAETVPSLRARYGDWFDGFETMSVALFTLEYIARLWTAVEVPFLRRLPPWRARLSWARHPFLLIDLVAILPFYFQHMFGLDLRVARALRLMRFLKLSRYSPAMHTLVRVLYNERRALIAAGYLLCAAVLFAATGIYMLENAAQPDKFGSVPESAWWAIATLTTVGYGDVAPITPWGKVFGSFMMVAGLCILALPVAIISAGFAQEVGRRDFVINWSLMSRIPLLAELDARQVAEIMPLFHAHNLPPNVEVIERGANGSAIYFIASGQIEMVAETFRRRHGTGDVFGVVSMLGNDVSHGAFRTITRSRLLKLYKEDFRRLEALNPELARKLRHAALNRLQMRECIIAEHAARLTAAADPPPPSRTAGREPT